MALWATKEIVKGGSNQQGVLLLLQERKLRNELAQTIIAEALEHRKPEWLKLGLEYGSCINGSIYPEM